MALLCCQGYITTELIHSMLSSRVSKRNCLILKILFYIINNGEVVTWIKHSKQSVIFEFLYSHSRRCSLRVGSILQPFYVFGLQFVSQVDTFASIETQLEVPLRSLQRWQFLCNIILFKLALHLFACLFLVQISTQAVLLHHSFIALNI